MKTLLLIFLFSSFSQATVLLSINEAMYAQFSSKITIDKKTLLLKKDEAKILQKNAKTKIKSKLFKVYLAKKDSKIVGFGVLINKKIRSKNGVILYMLDLKGAIKTIEVIAFNEPLDYLPSKQWKNQFNNIQINQSLQVGKNIPTITGATLSAKSITKASRVVQALYNLRLKDLL